MNHQGPGDTLKVESNTKILGHEHSGKSIFATTAEGTTLKCTLTQLTTIETTTTLIFKLQAPRPPEILPENAGQHA